MNKPLNRFYIKNDNAINWSAALFHEVFDFLSSKPISRDQLNYEAGVCKNIHYGDILTKLPSIVEYNCPILPYVNSDIDTSLFSSLNSGDIVIADTAEDYMVGTAVEVSVNDGEVITAGLHTMACRPKIKFAKSYLGYYLNSPAFHNQLKRLVTGTKVLAINKSEIINTVIKFPSFEEQQKIAEFFTALDEKIRIAENQLELFESAYKALMAQVFLKNNNEGIWQTIKLKDICKRVTRKNTDNRCDIPLTISSADGLVNQLSYFSKKIASKDMSKYYLLKRGEFAYNKSYSSGYDFGSIKRLKLFDEGALSTLYICFSIDCVNNEYMEYYFDSLSWYKNISKLCGEGARNHGLLNIGTSDFFDMELTIHKSPVDQEKIVNLFSCFSKKVSTLKQRVLLYKQLKKAFMQRMFV